MGYQVIIMIVNSLPIHSVTHFKTIQMTDYQEQNRRFGHIFANRKNVIITFISTDRSLL